MPKVSVIVPCYNTEKYVASCLDSLLGQSLSDIEIICIDDNSTDATLRVLKKYAAQDSRIIVKSQKQNSGVSVARNTGVRHASGEYIAFVDSDDTVDSDFYEKLYNAAKKENADIARGELKSVNIQGQTEYMLLNSRIKRNKYYFNLCFTTAIYRTALIRKYKLGFPVGISMAEDRYFLISAVHYAKKIVTIDNTFYNYIRRDNSLDSAAFSSDKIDYSIHGSRKLLDWVNTLDGLDSESMDILVRCVAETVKYLLSKHLTNHDCAKVATLMCEIYEKTTCRDVLKDCWGLAAYKHIKNKDIDKLVRYYMTQTKYMWLFGVLPLCRTTRYMNQEFQFYLFGFLPVFKIRRTHKTEYFVCGIMVLKIK